MTFSILLPRLINCCCPNLKRCTFPLIEWRSRFWRYLQGADSGLLMWWQATETPDSLTSSDETRLEHLPSEHCSRRLPWRFSLISQQVSYSEGFTRGSYPASAQDLYGTAWGTEEAAPGRDNTACLCSRPCEILTLRCHCNERQSNISLIISGMISCQWAVDEGV